MNEQYNTASTVGLVDAAQGFTLVGLLIVLARHKKLLVLFPLAVALATTAISYALPNVYKASTKLLPPQQAQSGAAALLSQLGGAASVVAGAAGIKNPNDTYIGMLKSRTIADILIDKFDLQKVYDEDSRDKTRKELEMNTVITAGKDGLISIDVEDEDQKRVARIANGYVAELVKMTSVLAVTEAAQRRIFFERQLTMAKDNLANAEMVLKGALDTRGVISVDSDSRAIVETVARLRAQVSAKEIQLNSMQAFVTINNQEYKRALQELSSLRSELSKLENGRPAPAGITNAGANKQVGLENIKILRDVKYYQMLYELLAKQYEVARMDEARDAALIQVLDPALEPERKVKPRRAIIIILATLLAFIAAVAWSFIADAKRRAMATPVTARQWEELKTLARFR